MVDRNAAAPDFTLFNTAREPVSLTNFRGGKVVLAFFPAAFTSVCEKELCTFRDSMAKFNEMNAKVLGISVDSPFSNAAFATQNGLNFDVLSDYGREVVAAYGVADEDFAGLTGYTAAVRSVFVVDEQGTVAYRWLAPNPGVEPPYDEVAAALGH